MRLQAVFYRGHDPQWAFSPLSGGGAKAKGGRFNPIGVPALYLGATTDTVIVEMTHGFAHRLEPLTMISYDVDVDGIVDLRTPVGRRLLASNLSTWTAPGNAILPMGASRRLGGSRIDSARRRPAF